MCPNGTEPRRRGVLPHCARARAPFWHHRYVHAVRGLAALIALLLVSGVGAVVLDAGPEAGEALRSAIEPELRDAQGNVLGDDEDSATCRRVLDVVEGGRRAEDLGRDVLDPFLVSSPELFVEVVEAASVSEIGYAAVETLGEELAHPTSHRQVLAVGRLGGSLEDLAASLDRRAAAEDWTPAGEGTQSSGDRLLALLRSYETGDGEQEVQAVACGRRGVFQHRVEPLRPSRLPPCAGTAIAARCAELEDLMEAVVGIPPAIDALDGGRLRAVVHRPQVPIDARVTGFSQVEQFQEAGWRWTNEADTGCRPWPSLPAEGGSDVVTMEPFRPCTGGGAPLASTPAVLRFSRDGVHGRYEAEVQTAPLTGTSAVASTFSAVPR